MSTAAPKALTVVDLAREAESLAPGLPSRLLAQFGGSGVRLAVYRGEGDWHAHPETDEFFLVMEGDFEVDIFEGSTTRLTAGQGVVIPAGVVHRPRSTGRCVLLCVKPLEGPTTFYEVVDGA